MLKIKIGGMSYIVEARKSNMGAPLFQELKKQASFFLKDKIRTARLALTDVTPAQLLTEEATNGSPWAPDTRTMGLISRAAFEVDDYWRIVEILHKRLSRFNRKQWREPYQALILLEHLLTHDPESVASEFQIDKDVIAEIGNFQYIDERGFNWGFTVRKKSERILQLLEKGALLKEERARARKLTREIKGFGSFNVRSSSSTAGGSFGDIIEATTGPYGRWNSHYSEYEQQERDEPTPTKKEATEAGAQPLHILVTEEMEDMSLKVPPYHRNDTSMRPPLKENVAERKLQKVEKENVAPMKKVLVVEAQGRWEDSVETNPLVDYQGEQGKVTEIPGEDHPFSKTEHLASASLLSVS